MTIRYVVSPKGGAGKTHVSVMLGRLLPDPVVIEHYSANDAALAFPAAARMRFMNEADKDVLALEKAIGSVADHQNIVVNTPPSVALSSLAKHADLLKPLGEQFGHESMILAVINDSCVFGYGDLVPLMQAFGPDMRIILNGHGPADPTRWRFCEVMEDHIAAHQTPVIRVPEVPHSTVFDFLRQRPPGQGLAVRTLANRYINAVKEVLI